MSQKQTRVVLKKFLGDRIKRLATDRGISLSSLEVQSGYSLGMITRWTNADEDENFEIFSKLATIADILGVSVGELLGVEDPKSKAPYVEKPKLISRITVATEEKRLQWMETNWELLDELPLKQPQESEERTLAGRWSAECGRLRFLLVTYCDDPDDVEEPMSFQLYAVAGHGIPAQPIEGETSELRTLYMEIQLQAAYDYL